MKQLLQDWFNSCFVHEVEWYLKSKKLALLGLIVLESAGFYSCPSKQPYRLSPRKPPHHCSHSAALWMQASRRPLLVSVNAGNHIA
jgi:hypothetical protein